MEKTARGMLAGPSEAVRPTCHVESHTKTGFRMRPSCSGAFFHASLSAQTGHCGLFFFTSIGQYLQNAANTFVSKCFRCVVLLHSADEASEKRVLRWARFSELLRTLLIDREHLSHFDTLTYKKRLFRPTCG